MVEPKRVRVAQPTAQLLAVVRALMVQVVAQIQVQVATMTLVLAAWRARRTVSMHGAAGDDDRVTSEHNGTSVRSLPSPTACRSPIQHLQATWRLQSPPRYLH